MRRASPEGYIIEIIRIGAFAKATAVDPDTGIEVSVSGPSQGADAMLTRTAVRRLEQRLKGLKA
ncbi:DUF6898 family protein [Lacibacterium aquatile]|uniref:DUF6898 family protein n=1 Tax=Lacibacterium aquatile TaxID=1168082 RepID=A0ABW5DQ17_9PROT